MLTISRYNKKLIQRGKVLVLSLPVNTTKVILPLKQTNQIDFNIKTKRLIQQTFHNYFNLAMVTLSLKIFQMPKLQKGDNSLIHPCAIDR